MLSSAKRQVQERLQRIAAERKTALQAGRPGGTEDDDRRQTAFRRAAAGNIVIDLFA